MSTDTYRYLVWRRWLKKLPPVVQITRTDYDALRQQLVDRNVEYSQLCDDFNIVQAKLNSLERRLIACESELVKTHELLRVAENNARELPAALMDQRAAYDNAKKIISGLERERDQALERAVGLPLTVLPPFRSERKTP